MVMFDLPVGTKVDRRNYQRFHKKLVENGYWMLQYSVYARSCNSDDTGKSYKERLRKWLPPAGQVRILMFTDKQFGNMEVFDARYLRPPEKPPEQLTLF